MAKTRWTKRRKTKRVKDIHTPVRSDDAVEYVGTVNVENSMHEEEETNPVKDGVEKEPEEKETEEESEEKEEESEEKEEESEEKEKESEEKEEESDEEVLEEENGPQEKEKSGNEEVEEEEKENSGDEDEEESQENSEDEGELQENSEDEAEDDEGISERGREEEGVGERDREEENVEEHNSDEEERNPQSTDSDDEPRAIKPLAMYFPPTEYRKKIKLSTRCFIAEVLQTLLKDLDPPMNNVEKSWFETHPPFKHIFHMPQDGNHKVMGMWMLLLRTIRIQKEKEAWFAVNGSPIRYGIREHGLISGLNCGNYPVNYKKAGGTRFVRKMFGNGVVRYQDVKEKVQERMEPSRDRLRLLVLYFLTSIIAGQRKSGKDAPPVDPFLLRAVDDLNLCQSFPWGRFSFDYMMKEIAHTMAHFEGEEVKEGVNWPLPGFCIPMELLAFEAIPKLGEKFRVAVDGVDPECPRMCKSKFKRSEMKGFPLSKINKALGSAKDIENILSVTDEERGLLERITEPDDIDDHHDVIVESWMKRIQAGYVVRFEDMFDEDVAARTAALNTCAENAGNETSATREEENIGWMKKIEEWMKKVDEKMEEFGLRIAASEAFVQEAVDGLKRKKKNEGVGNSKRAKKNT